MSQESTLYEAYCMITHSGSYDTISMDINPKKCDCNEKDSSNTSNVNSAVLVWLQM